MAALPEPLLMTVEDFNALPEETGEFYYELHFGELVEVSRAKWKHESIQATLRDALKILLDAQKWYINSEMSFRVAAEYDLRGADVGIVAKSRADAVNPEGYLLGAPEIVIEVKSRSNTHSSLRRRAAACLANGSQEFWVVYPIPKTVLVITNASSIIYSADQRISVLGATLDLTSIFR